MAVSKELKRFNLSMSHSLFNFYADLAGEMGISISSAMVMALKVYADQQKGLSMSSDMKMMIEQITKIQSIESQKYSIEASGENTKISDKI